MNETKSGQSTDELYTPSWVHYQSLLFLLPVKHLNEDTYKRKIDVEECQETDDEDEDKVSTRKRKTIAERKLNLLSKCTDAITKPAKVTAPPVVKPSTSNFAAYVDERLSKLGNRERRYAEKQISDVLFNIEMQSDNDGPGNNQMSYGNYSTPSYFNSTPLQGNNGNSSFHNSNTTTSVNTHYTDMINNPF